MIVKRGRLNCDEFNLLGSFCFCYFCSKYCLRKLSSAALSINFDLLQDFANGLFLVCILGVIKKFFQLIEFCIFVKVFCFISVMYSV